MAVNQQLTNTNGDNHVWRNVGASPLVSFSFMLRVEGLWDLPCKRITGVRRENEFDYIQEGGLNDYVHSKRKPISKPFTFQVERYVGVDLEIAADPLALGTELVLPLILFVNKYAVWSAKDMRPVRTYAFTGCTVISKDYGELNAEQSGLLVETTTISYREMVCVDIYSDLQGMTLDTWSFDAKDRSQSGSGYTGKYHKEGEGPRRYNQAVSNTTELTKDEMNKRASLWPKKSSANKPAASKPAKDPKARLWPKEASAQKRKVEGKDPEARIWPPKESAQKRKVKGEDPKARVWPPQESARKRSAQGKDPKARVWPDEQSAQKRGTGGKDPKPRVWPTETSAQQRGAEGVDMEARVWPDEQSAQKRGTQGEDPRLRTWPPQESAQKRGSAQAKQAARLWPKAKSAQSITQYLSDYPR